MAQKIRGITIEIGADTAGVMKALGEVNTKINATSRELKDIDKLLKLDPTNTTLLTQKTQALQTQIAQTKDKLSELKEAQKTMDQNGVDKNSEQYQALQREIIATEQELKKLESTVGSGSATMAKISAVTGEVGEKMESAGKKMLPVTAAITGLGAIAVKTAADFDTSMSQVQATMGITADAVSELDGESVNTMDALRDLAQEMGSKTKFSATECADALNYLALAGYDTQEMADTLPTVLNLAAAGNMDLARASDMVTDAMSALGMTTDEAESMVDIMAKTASSTNTSVEQLGDGMLKIGGTAKNLSGGTEELATALGILANNGIKGAEGGTHLRNIIMSLQSPTTDAANAMTELGIDLYDTEGKMRPLNDVLGDLNASMDGMTDAQKTDIINRIFNKTDISSVNALLANTGEAWDNLQGSISDSAGAAQQMADTQLDNLQGQLTLLKSALEGLAISVGEIIMPIIQKVVGAVQSIVDWLNSLDEGTKTTIVTIGAIVAAIGPLLIVGGKVLQGISKITGALSTVGGTTWGPIGLVIAGVAAATAAIIAWQDALYKAALEASPFTDDLKDLKDANDELSTSIATTKEKYENEQEALETNAGYAEALTEKLNELMGAYDGSTESSEKIKLVVDELNKVVPDLGLAWDEATNSLNLNTEEIYNQINAMKAQAQVAALQDYYTESLKEQYQAEKNLSDAQQMVIDMANKYGVSADLVTRALQGDTNAVIDYTNAIRASGLSDEETAVASGQLTDAIVAVNEAVLNSANATSNAKYAEEELGNAMMAAAEAAAESAKSIEDRYQETFGTAMPEILQTAVNAAKDAGYSVPQSIVNELMNGELSVEQAATKITNYLDQKQAAAEHGTETAEAYVDAETETIESSEPAMDKTVKKSCKPMDQTDVAADYGEANADAYVDATTKKIIYSEEVIEDTAESAMSGLDQYDTSYDYGDNSGQGYADGFENTADEAAAATKVVYDEYVDGMDGLPDEMNTSGSTAGQKLDSGFGDNSGSISKTIDSIWNLYYNSLGVSLKGKMWEWGYAAGGALGRGLKETNISGSIGTVIDNIQSAMWDVYVMMYNAGGDAGRGFYNGWGSWADNIRIQAYNIAVDAANAARDALNINSPSKVMQQIGEYTGEGLALGIEDSASNVYSAMDAITDQISKTQPEMTIGVNALNAQAMQSIGTNEMAETLNTELGTVETLLSQYLPYLAQQTSIVLDDGTLAGHMAPAMNDALTKINKQAARG